MLGNLLQPIAQRVQLITEPFQPVLDIVKKRIPALSDLSETMGGPPVDLVFLSNALSALPNPPTEFINAVHTADTLRRFAETVNMLAGQGGNGWIDIGSFGLSGPGGTSLLDTAASSLGNLNAGKWSDLVFNGNGIDFDGIKSQIRDLVGDEIGDEINSLWDALSGEFQGN